MILSLLFAATCSRGPRPEPADAGVVTPTGGRTGRGSEGSGMLCINSLYPRLRSDAGAGWQSGDFRPSEVLILFDQSESTGMAFGSGTRGSAMADALGSLVEAYQGRIAFGLMAFPDAAQCGENQAPGCCVGAPLVDVGLKQGAVIRAALDSRPAPRGSSPMALALQRAAGVFQGRAFEGASRLILLATDGQPGCAPGPGDASSAAASGCQDVARIVRSLADLNPPIRTLVLSPGPGDPMGETDCLQALGEAVQANQGHDASLTSDSFTTLDLASLQDALEATFLPGRATEPSCEIDLTPDPSPHSNFSVYINDQMIPEDSSNGWKVEQRYLEAGDAGRALFTVSLRGLYCQRLKQYRYDKVEVRYDCPIGST